LRAGLTFAAPTVLAGLARRKGNPKTRVQTTNLGHPQAGECRTYGASGLFFQATQRLRAGLTFAAPTVLAGWRGGRGTPRPRFKLRT
jgi:hypothetical protein